MTDLPDPLPPVLAIVSAAATCLWMPVRRGRHHVHQEGSRGSQEVLQQIPGFEARVTEATEGPADSLGSVECVSPVFLLSVCPSPPVLLMSCSCIRVMHASSIPAPLLTSSSASLLPSTAENSEPQESRKLFDHHYSQVYFVFFDTLCSLEGGFKIKGEYRWP